MARHSADGLNFVLGAEKQRVCDSNWFKAMTCWSAISGNNFHVHVLTANPILIKTPKMAAIACRHSKHNEFASVALSLDPLHYNLRSAGRAVNLALATKSYLA